MVLFLQQPCILRASMLRKCEGSATQCCESKTHQLGMCWWLTSWSRGTSTLSVSSSSLACVNLEDRVEEEDVYRSAARANSSRSRPRSHSVMLGSRQQSRASAEGKEEVASPFGKLGFHGRHSWVSMWSILHQDLTNPQPAS